VVKTSVMSNIAGGTTELDGLTIDFLCADAEAAKEAGLSTYWLSQLVQRHEAMNLIGVIGTQVDGIEFGTAVIPTYPRHPMVMAEQALTTSWLTGGRFRLGIGLSHPVVVEGMWGLSYDAPLRHMREYLDALLPLLAGERTRAKGEEIVARGQLEIPNAPRPEVLLAALGPQMLRLAAQRCDGTITWLTGAKTLAEHTVPVITEAAEEASRPAPQVIAGIPFWVTDDVDRARRTVANRWAGYETLPSYRAMLDREGANAAEDIAIVGDEATCSERLDEFAAGGVTEVLAIVVADDEEGQQRTRALLSERARSGC
jgi:F420-dependent oxidoreductase-like protein